MVSADIQHHVYFPHCWEGLRCPFLPSSRFAARHWLTRAATIGRSAVQRHFIESDSQAAGDGQCVLLEWVAPVIVGLSLLYLCVVSYSLCVSIPPLPPLPVTEDLGSGIAWDETCETTYPLRQSCRGGNASAVRHAQSCSYDGTTDSTGLAV